MTIEERVVNSIDIKDLDENLQYFAEVIGLENVRKLILEVGGSRFYIPKPDKFKTKALGKHLLNNRLGRTDKCRMERMFGLCSITVDAIWKKIYNTKKLTRKEIENVEQ